jgi:hypothetical protein
MAPSVVFFALTGAAQIFNLHEAHGNYHPPAFLEKLSSVHKDQEFKLGDRRDPPPSKAESQEPSGGTASGAAPDDHDKTDLSTLALKVFFLLVALCLLLSTVLGLWMGLTQTRQKRIAWMLVLAGALIPVGLLLF